MFLLSSIVIIRQAIPQRSQLISPSKSKLSHLCFLWVLGCLSRILIASSLAKYKQNVVRTQKRCSQIRLNKERGGDITSKCQTLVSLTQQNPVERASLWLDTNKIRTHSKMTAKSGYTSTFKMTVSSQGALTSNKWT